MRHQTGAAKRIGITTEDYIQRIKSGLKRCSICKTWKIKEEYYIDNTRWDGLQTRCRSCDHHRIQPGPDKRERRLMLKKDIKWCSGCEEWHTSKKVRGGVCQKHHNAYMRRKYAEDKKYRDSRKQRSSARKRGVEPVPPEGRETLLEAFQGKCAYCSNPANTWDHIVPVIKGGKTNPGNIVPACNSCNSSKNDTEVFEWLKRKGWEPSLELLNRIIIAEVWGY